MDAQQYPTSNKIYIEPRYFCNILRKNIDLKKSSKVDECPLIEVPKHGRLIDADALIAMCKTMEEIEWNNKAAPYSWAYAYESFESDIDDAPTIIEAEEER